MTTSNPGRSWMDVDYESMPRLQISLLDTAAEVFSSFGFMSASVDTIAKKIGATKGAVYYHYRSKTDLFFAVHKRALQICFRALLPVVNDNTLDEAERLRRMAYEHAMLMMVFPYYQRVTVQGVELHRSASTTAFEREQLDELIATRDAYEQLFRRALEDGVRAGVFKAIDCRLAARGILGALNWITVWYKPRESDSDEYRMNVAQQLSHQVIHGVF